MKKKVLIIALVLVIVIGIVAAVMFMNREEKPWKPDASTTGSGNAGVTDDVTYGDVTDDDTASSPETDEVADSETEKNPVSSETNKPETNKPETSKPVTEKPETTAPANEETTANDPSTEKPETDKKDEPVKNDPPVKNECSGGHSFGAWKEVTKATCTSTGAQIRTCKKCGVSERKTVNVKDHTEVNIPAVAATCANYGYTEGKKCSVCGTVTVSPDRLPMLSHSFSAWTRGKNPTCSSDGYDVRTCQKCSYQEKDYIPATGKHTYVNGACKDCGYEVQGTKGLEYRLSNDGTYYICTGISSSTVKSIIIPPYYNGKPVKAVDAVFTSITDLTISEGIERIEDGQIYSTKLKSITIPSSVKYIDGAAFSMCYNLEEVYVNTTGWRIKWKNTAIQGDEAVDFSNPYQAANVLRRSRTQQYYSR